MNWQDVSDTLKKIGAPLLSGLVAGGPVGAAASAAISLLANEIGSDEPAKILEQLKPDNNAVAQNIVNLETQNKIELQRLLLQQAQVDAGEMANARAREENMAKIAVAAGLPIDKTPRQIAIMFTWGFIACNAIAIIAKFFYPTISFDTAIQTLNNGEMFILGYYFGSSNKVRKV